MGANPSRESPSPALDRLCNSSLVQMDPDLKKFAIQIKSARSLALVRSRFPMRTDRQPKTYIKITSGESTSKTKTARRGVDATWNETLSLDVPEGERVIFEACHDGKHGRRSIGKAVVFRLKTGEDQEFVLETGNGSPAGWLTVSITLDNASNVTKKSNDAPSRLAHVASVAQDYGGVTWEFTKTILKKLPDFTDMNPAKAALEIVKTILELKEGLDDNLNAIERRIRLTTRQIQLLEDEIAGWEPESVEKARWMDQFNKTLGQGLKKLYELRDQSKAKSLLVQEADAQRIEDIFEDINEARMRFVVEVGIRTFKSVYDMGETLRVGDDTSGASHLSSLQQKLFLDRLMPSRSADHKSGSQQEMMGRTACTPGTRVGLLDSIISWAKDTSTGSPNVFWLFGPAGSGKSTIACTIARRFEFTGALDSALLLGGNFFCSRQSEETRDSRRIIPTLAYQLSLICKPFADALHQSGNFESIHHDVQAQIQRLLVKPWQESKTARGTDQQYLVVIDALDEIEGNGGSKFLQNLFVVLNKSDLSGLKFFVTSRPDPDLVTKVDMYEQKTSFRLQDVNKAEVLDDIGKYLKTHLEDLTDSDEMIGKLVEQSDGLFIYASTVVRHLEDYGPTERKHRVLELLSNPGSSPADSPLLDDLYQQILAHALHGKSDEYRRRRLDVLHAFVCTSERTSVDVVAHLLYTTECASTNNGYQLHYSPDTITLYKEAADHILKKLHAVLYIADNRVLSYHKSFSDFLFSEGRSQAFWCDQAAQHQRLAQSCLDVMKVQLQFNIAKIPSSFIFDRNNPALSSEVERNISAVLSYSCRHWNKHVCATPSTTSNHICHTLMDFLQLRALFWIEAMNLLELRGRCYAMLRAAGDWVNTVDSVLASNLAEAARFALYFSGSAAASSTPHLYVSSLATWPRNLNPCCGWKDSFHGIPVFYGAQRQGDSVVLMTLNVKSKVRTVGFSKDGSRIVSGSYDNIVRVWDASTGEVLRVLDGHTDRITSIALSNDGTQIVSGSYDKTVRVWDASTGDELKMLHGHNDWVTSVAFSNDGSRIVSGSGDKTMRVWHTSTGGELNTLHGHTNPVTSVAFSNDDRCIVSGSYDNTVRVWDASTGAEIEVLYGHNGWVHSVAFSNNGSRIVSGSYDNTVRVWDAYTGDELKVLDGHTDPVGSVAFSNDGTRIASGSEDNTVRVWDASTGDELEVLYGHTDPVNSVVFSNDDSRIISGSGDKTVRVWDASTSEEFKVLDGHNEWVTSVAFSKDGSCIVSGSGDNTVRVWDASTGGELKVLNGHNDWVTSVVFSKDGSRIFSGSGDKTVRVWDASTGQEVKVLDGHTNPVTSVSSNDDSQIVSGSGDKTVRVWDALAGDELKVLDSHTSSVTSVAFSNDGSWIVSGSYDHTVRVWDASTGCEIKVLDGHNEWVTSVAFSTDGSRIVSGSEDSTLRVWDTSTGDELKVLGGHTDSVTSVAFSNDGARIASGSGDNTVRVWDACTGDELQVLDGHTGPVTSVAFSNDGGQIVSGSYDKTVRVWNTPRGNGHIPRIPRYVREHNHRVYTGWLVSPSGEGYLMFVPPAAELPDDGNVLTIPLSALPHIDFTNASLGDRWQNCYRS